MVDQISRSQAARILKGSLNKRYQQHPEYNVGLIKDLIKDGDETTITGAIVEIGGELTEIDAPSGRGQSNLIPGAQWLVRKPAGNILGARWEFDTNLTTPIGGAGTSPSAHLVTPVVPAAVLGGFRTYEGKSQSDPGGPTVAQLSVYPRSTILGVQTLYDWTIANIALQVQLETESEWGATILSPLNPSFRMMLVLDDDIDESTTSLPVTNPGLIFPGMPAGVPLYWRVGGEVVLGVWDGANEILVVAHDGVGNAEFGLGFEESEDGRGKDGTTPASWDEGTRVELFSITTRAVELRPGQAYRLRVAAVAASGRQGPWSDAISFESWKQLAPPLAPDDLVVDHRSASLVAIWDRVIEDTAGNPRADVERYAVLRALASLGATFGIATYGQNMTIDELKTAIAAQPANSVALFDANLNATSVNIPATFAFGNFVGVAAIDASGNWGEWSWEQDNLAPPYPDPADVVMYEVEEGISYRVPEVSTSFMSQSPGSAIPTAAHFDPGFKEYILLVAGAPDGTGAAVAGRAPGSGGTIPIEGGTTGWYKLVAADSTGNYNNGVSPNNAGFSTGWKFIFSRYAELGLPPNGNFQIPDQAGTNAKGWTPNINGGVTGMDFVYQNTGGLEGNKVYRFIVPSSPPSGPFGNEEGVVAGDLLRVIPATTGTGVVGTMWLYQDSGSTKQYLCYLGFAGSSDDDTWLADAGSFILETPSAVSIPSGTWTKVTINSVYDTLESNARSGRWLAWFRAVPGVGSGTDYSIYMDALKVTF